MSTITVLGSINLDLTAGVVRLPQPGETVPAPSFMTTPGGKGANQALAARRAGAQVRMAGAVGMDAFAKQAVALLQAAGVALDAVEESDAETGLALILRGGDGENMIAVVPGANGTVTPERAEQVLMGIGGDDIVLMQLELPPETVAAALRLCRERGARSLLNIAPFLDLETVRSLAADADVVIGNQTEFEALVGRSLPDVDTALTALRTYHSETRQSFILTLGAAGAAAAEAGSLHRAAGLAIAPVDTVGAGDTFCGYLAAALAEGKTLPAALHLATTAGSLACLKPGAQAAIPDRDAVDTALTGKEARQSH